MLAQLVITGWDWAIFVIAIVLFLMLDLGVFHRKAHVVGFREALAWSTVWFTLAITFGLFIAPRMTENLDLGRTRRVHHRLYHRAVALDG
jgi:hypothetical protein